MDTVCPVRPREDVVAEYIRYPVCLEARWAGSGGSGNGNGKTTGTEGSSDGAGADSHIATNTNTNTATNTNTNINADTDADTDTDTESPLDNSKFLSFEEWKKQNLAKAGQSAENMRGHRQGGDGQVGDDGAGRRRARPREINNALDSLGDETEIELEFGGFGTDNSGIASWERREGQGQGQQRDAGTGGGGDGDGNILPTKPRAEAESLETDGVPRRGISRRKDAGTTCKERFNYASFDCAATVLKTNPQCTGSSAVLVENKDSYMLNECRAGEKFLILELCDDILVDTVVLANYEFFSSIFRTFRVSVTDRYPAKADKWRDLGTYEAANTREVQAFPVENPLIWARYLKIEFLSHYGNEFYCPVSLIRVHGTTMMEEYKNDGEATRAEEEASVELAQEQQQQQQEQKREQSVADTIVPGEEVETASIVGDSAANATLDPLQGLSPGELVGLNCFMERNETESILLGLVSDEMCAIRERAAMLALQSALGGKSHPSTDDESASPTSDAPAGSSKPDNSSSAGSPSSAAAPSAGSEGHPSPGAATTDNSTHTEPSRTPVIAPPPPPPNPTTQESFFKSVNKRLQMLETNSTLSLLYIEEQSRILRDAFNNVEKRQFAKTSNFLENLNTTVLDELKEFRQQYDHLWHSVFIEFEQQRQQYHREVYAVGSQLGILADELVFQKRVSIIQSVFVLVCFGVVLFSRTSTGTYLEFPRVQNIVSRSHSFRSASPPYASPLQSGSPSPSQSPSHSVGGDGLDSSSTLQRGHHSRHHHRNPSDDQADCDVCNPSFTYSPPTPTSEATSPSEAGDEKRLRFVHVEAGENSVSTASEVGSVSEEDVVMRRREAVDSSAPT